jgi:hypothetical protein
LGAAIWHRRVFELTELRTTIFALFISVDEPIAKNRLALRTELSAHSRPGRLAVLGAAIVHDTVSTKREPTARSASIAVEEVAIVAHLGSGPIPVTTGEDPESEVDAA